MKSIEIPYFLYLFHVFSTHWYFHQVPSTPDSPVRAGVLRPTHVRSVGVVTTPHLVGFRRVNFGLISGSVQSCGIIVKWYLTWLNFRRVQHPTMKSYANKQRLLNSPITIGIQWYSYLLYQIYVILILCSCYIHMLFTLIPLCYPILYTLYNS